MSKESLCRPKSYISTSYYCSVFNFSPKYKATGTQNRKLNGRNVVMKLFIVQSRIIKFDFLIYVALIQQHLIL